ncbi:MAG: hypothetical protein O3B41_03235 [Bacteroidetes bacterium]|nr:hypothetical protein [Bacteroidota bacterium]
MTEDKKNRSKEYSSTREAFDDLKIEEKAFFLLESTAKAVIDSVQEAVETLSGAMNDAFTSAKEEIKKKKAKDSSEKNGEASSDDASSKQASSKEAQKSAGSAKTKTKKSAAKKTVKKASPSDEK